MNGIYSRLEAFLHLAPVLLVPLPQVLLFIVLISVAAAFERYRLILILSYIFAVYWVFIENLKQLAANEATVISVVIFLVFGLLALFLMIHHSVSSRDD